MTNYKKIEENFIMLSKMKDDKIYNFSYCSKCAHAIYESHLCIWENKPNQQQEEVFKCNPKQVLSTFIM